MQAINTSSAWGGSTNNPDLSITKHRLLQTFGKVEKIILIAWLLCFQHIDLCSRNMQPCYAVIETSSSSGIVMLVA